MNAKLLQKHIDKLESKNTEHRLTLNSQAAVELVILLQIALDHDRIGPNISRTGQGIVGDMIANLEKHSPGIATVLRGIP